MRSIPAGMAAPVARLLAASLWRSLVDEHAFRFYASRVDPLASSTRIFARVEAVRAETNDVRSFVLRPNAQWRGFRAGQHVPLSVEIAGVRHTRLYSPSSAPADAHVTLTVKRHPHGRVSGHLHDRLAPGDVVELGAPLGDAVLPEPVPPKVLLIGGGSGITPLMSIVRDVVDRGHATDIVVANYASTARELIFADELQALERRHSNLHVALRATHASGRLCASHVDAFAADAAERCTFACGPVGFVEAVHGLWRDRGYPRSPRSEAFVAAAAVGEARDVALHFVRSSREIQGTNHRPLLAQAEAAGLRPPSGCRMGICLSCTCRKRSGTVKNLVTGAISAEPDEDVRLCISVPLTDVVLDL
jgi:stearoyl-CoA 9-desaturase NADPH oxidoreductase